MDEIAGELGASPAQAVLAWLLHKAHLTSVIFGVRSVEQLEDLVDISLNECERFYPAFQFVVWGGKKPAEAIEAAILETCGEA